MEEQSAVVGSTAKPEVGSQTARGGQLSTPAHPPKIPNCCPRSVNHLPLVTFIHIIIFKAVNCVYPTSKIKRT